MRRASLALLLLPLAVSCRTSGHPASWSLRNDQGAALVVVDCRHQLTCSKPKQLQPGMELQLPAASGGRTPDILRLTRAGKPTACLIVPSLGAGGETTLLSSDADPSTC